MDLNIFFLIKGRLKIQTTAERVLGLVLHHFHCLLRPSLCLAENEKEKKRFSTIILAAISSDCRLGFPI